MRHVEQKTSRDVHEDLRGITLSTRTQDHGLLEENIILRFSLLTNY